jgi:PleD family two-component response regulator
MGTSENRSIKGAGGELGRIMDKELFLHILDLEVKRAWRYQNFLCFLVLSIDQCSNENNGSNLQMCHEVLSDLLRVDMRESDILASFGLNQLVVLLPYADRSAGSKAKSRLENTLKYFEFRKRGYEVKVHEVCFPMDGTCTKDLIKRMFASETN